MENEHLEDMVPLGRAAAEGRREATSVAEYARFVPFQRGARHHCSIWAISCVRLFVSAVISSAGDCDRTRSPRLVLAATMAMLCRNVQNYESESVIDAAMT